MNINQSFIMTSKKNKNTAMPILSAVSKWKKICL